MSVARQAESHLEVQKQENLQLKETIDRMRFELDEAKTTAQGHSRGVTGSSGAPTLSRNLGAELSRRLVEAEEQDEEEDSYVETVVTRQRTRVNPFRTHLWLEGSQFRKLEIARSVMVSIAIHPSSKSRKKYASTPTSGPRLSRSRHRL